MFSNKDCFSNENQPRLQISLYIPGVDVTCLSLVTMMFMLFVDGYLIVEITLSPLLLFNRKFGESFRKNILGMQRSLMDSRLVKTAYANY